MISFDINQGSKNSGKYGSRKARFQEGREATNHASNLAKLIDGTFDDVDSPIAILCFLIALSSFLIKKETHAVVYTRKSI